MIKYAWTGRVHEELYVVQSIGIRRPHFGSFYKLASLDWPFWLTENLLVVQPLNLYTITKMLAITMDQVAATSLLGRERWVIK